MFKIESEIPLPSKCLAKYDGLAFDGCWFYVTLYCMCQVIQFDKCFHQVRCFDTRRSYSNLCYDPKERCFWATSDKCLSMVYKLNECFEEIDCFHIYTPDICCKNITGISYNCCKDNLMVSCPTGIVCVNKNNPKDVLIIKKSCKEWIMNMIFVCPYYICYCFSGQKKKIQIYSRCGTLIKECSVPGEFFIDSIVFNPCKKGCSHCHFYILASKHSCYPYILDCVLECDEICDSICDCNYEICEKKCSYDEADHKQACCDVLKSVALVEASIAHILNAEGEKLQKVIASTDNVCEIMEVNNSVNKTIISSTHLEQLLYEKMEVLRQCCDFCKDKDKDKDCEYWECEPHNGCSGIQ